jgi:hypothetical protein
VVGASEGDGVGEIEMEGDKVGRREEAGFRGAYVGTTDGKEVGKREGKKEGIDDGDKVGLKEGKDVGNPVG